MSELPPSQPTVQRTGGAWVGAIVLIGLGVYFLLTNFHVLPFINNWWALFILLGTAGAWGSALRIYQNNGHRMTPAVTGTFIGGLFPLAVALIFLFNMNWGIVWPVFLVIAGIAVLARSFGAPNN